jgi:WD40 repeat protein
LIAQLVQKNEGFVQALHFNPDGARLADATLGAIHILDLAPMLSGLSGAELVKIPMNNNKVRLNSIYFTPAGDRLVTVQLGTLKDAGENTPLENEIQIWDATTGFLLLNIQPEQQLLSGVISPDGQTFFTAHVGGVIHSWDISNLGSPEGMAATAGGNGGALNLSPDGKQLLEMDQVDLEAGTYQFSWQRIDGGQAVPLGHFTISLGERQAMVLVDKNLSRIVALDLRNLCRVFDAADGQLLREFQLGEVGPNGVAIVLNADASRLLMQSDLAHSDSLIEVWDVPAGSRLFQFHIADWGFLRAFTPDGKGIITYASNNAPNLIRWWDPAPGQKTNEIDPQHGTIYGLVFTPDGKFWLSWGEDQTVKIHDAATGKLVRTLSPAAQINSVMVSPDSHTIAVSLTTAQTTLYSFEDGHELVTLPGASIGFFPDRLAVLNTISGDPSVYAFSLNNTDLVRLACGRLKNISSSNGVASPRLKICQDQGQ